MSDFISRLRQAGVILRKPRAAVASPLPLLAEAKPLPAMRPLEFLGDDLYPASGLTVRQRERAPGSVYPDEIEAIESVLPSLQQDIADGLAAGYGQWYFTGPLQERFRRVLGRVQGDREFRRYMGLTSAASNQSPVPQEIKKGGLYFNMYHQGILPAEADYKVAIERVRQAREQGLWPSGYGHRNQATDMLKAADFLGTGRLAFPADPTGAHKIPDYYHQKLGNRESAAMDSWQHRWLGLPFDPRAYHTARQAVLQAAGDVPISEAQPAIWMIRGSQSDGFRGLSEPSWLHWWERQLKARSEELGEAPDKVIDGVIRGRQYMSTPQEWTKDQA